MSDTRPFGIPGAISALSASRAAPVGGALPLGKSAWREAISARSSDRVLIVSNRGPVEHCFQEGGTPAIRPGCGGVVSGLLCALGERPTTWIALAMTDADRVVAARGRSVRLPEGLSHIDLRLVDVPAATYRRYYDGISNKVLWFTQHYLFPAASGCPLGKRVHDDWERGYRATNEAVAAAVLAELERTPEALVLFQDYHLYLAPARVRATRPNARLAQFIHIPWPEARCWEQLPNGMAHAIFEGLAANDIIGFQTPRDARNFLDGAPSFLPGARVVREEVDGASVLLWQGRRILARAYPIAVTPREVRAQTRRPEAQAAYSALVDELRLDDLHRLIVRVDRVEPTKNIVRGFEAYERLLAQHPEHRGLVTFLALLVPSRQTMAAYRAYERQVRAAIARVNARFGTEQWQPIVAVFGNDRERALACMRRYDVLLVNPLIDGMNLVVKEGGLVNARGGVAILSRTAGAYAQLHAHVLGIAPTDVPATATALHTALTLPAEERAVRARGLRNLLQEEDARLWLGAQLDDLARRTSRAAAAAAQDTGAGPVCRLPVSLWDPAPHEHGPLLPLPSGDSEVALSL
jgi:trehalose 6-phosphate synthase